MTANRTPRPAITAADLAAAATRLAGAVVLDLADLTVGPALYLPRLAAFASIEDAEQLLGDDDGTLVVLVEPGTARDLIDAHGTPGRAAAALTRELRTAGAL
jgi:hypothetical protein